jgi:hypothetical protein
VLCAEADLEAPEIVAAMATPSAAPTTCRRENLGMVLAASDPWPWQRQPSRSHEPRPNSSPRDDIVLAPSSMLVF